MDKILERANTDLERRVRELVSLIKSAPSKGRPIPTSTGWKDLANWRQPRNEMSMDEVRELLVEPERVENNGPLTYWYWANAQADFFNGKLSGWSEPKR